LVSIFLFFEVVIALNSFTAPRPCRCSDVTGKEGKIVRYFVRDVDVKVKLL